MPRSKLTKPDRAPKAGLNSPTMGVVKPNTEQLIVPALRAVIGTWAYYAASLRFQDVAARVKFASEVHGTDLQLNELIQRSLEDRAADIATYLLRQKEERFLSALVVGVYEGDPKWYDATINATERIDVSQVPSYGLHALGLLVFNGRERLFALDGQHRVEGIRQALQQDSGLADEQVLVLFVGHQNSTAGLQRTRRLFTTLNRYAKPVSKSDLIALDEDDAVAILTRRLVMTHSLFHGHTSTRKQKSLPPSDKTNVTTIGALYDAMDAYLRNECGLSGREWRDYKRFRRPDEELKQLTERSVAMWDRAADAVSAWREVRNGPAETAGRLRDRKTGGSLWVRPIGTMMFADVMAWLRREGLSEPATIKRLAAAPAQLNEVPWVGLLWDPANHRMITRAENRRVASQILFHLCGGDLRTVKSTLSKLEEVLEGLLVSSVMVEGPKIPPPHADPISKRGGEKYSS